MLWCPVLRALQRERWEVVSISPEDLKGFAASQNVPATTRRRRILRVLAVALTTLWFPCLCAKAQSNEWAWMGGSRTSTTFGVYGTLGTPSPGNTPGSRDQSVSWTDTKGNLWLFGGEGLDSAGKSVYLNDLWEFNPTLNQWSWIGGSNGVSQSVATGQSGAMGVAASGNIPSGRIAAVGWTDATGNLWLFGGSNWDGLTGQITYLNDLWKFNPSTTEWTWMSGANAALEYTGPISIRSSETIQAVAAASGYASSDISTATYIADFSPAAAPTFSIASGTYTAPLTVEISDSTPGAVIYYAIGAESTATFNLYNGPIKVAAAETLQAYAVAIGYQQSPTDVAVYNLEASQPSGAWAWIGGNTTVPAICTSPGDCGPAGWYGTLQTAASGNMPGGRISAATWTDTAGNLWLFGGVGYDAADNQGFLNDLWKFNPSNFQWSWMHGGTLVTCSNAQGCGVPGVYGTLGTPAPGNTPGGRDGAAAWTDTKGRLWLYGGWGFDAEGSSGYLNDLWVFDTSNNQWTWIRGGSLVPCTACGQPGVIGTFSTPGAGNTPGGRVPAAKWIDGKGNLWLFGGLGSDSQGHGCYLNDLWEFDTSASLWAWEGGNQNCISYMVGLPAVFSPLGTPAVGSSPGSLVTAGSWTSANGNLWLFGGEAIDLHGHGYYVNDVWEFNPSLGQWAWVSANSEAATGTNAGAYGTLGTWSQTNVPGGRSANSSWTDNQGNFWIFGGTGVNAAPYLGTLNDLWEFNSSINEWVWRSGSNGFYQPGSYGVLGTPSSTNNPGARHDASGWTDLKGNLWLFGGLGYDGASGFGFLNDMWQYSMSGQVVTRPPSPAATPTFSVPTGSYPSSLAVTISDVTAGAIVYYTTDGTVPISRSAVYKGPIPVTSSETIAAIAVANGYTNSAIATAAYTLNLPPTATPAFSVSEGTYTAPQTLTISDATAGATIYFTTDGKTPTTSSAIYNSPITVNATETVEAIAVATGYSNSAVAMASYTINLLPTFNFEASPSSLAVPGRKLTELGCKAAEPEADSDAWPDLVISVWGRRK